MTGQTEPLGPETNPSLHHIGYVLPSISQVVERFARALAASWDGKVILDPLQGVRVAFLTHANSANPLVELVEPVGNNSPVMRFLNRGPGLHHICYEVNDLVTHLEYSRAMGGIIIQSPVPAVAFGGRRIAWVYTADRLLLEFLER